MKDIFVTAYGKDYSDMDELAKDNKEYCIYGCGLNGEIICQYLKNKGKDIAFFVDKQAEAREFLVLDKKVISPKVFFRDYRDIKVLVSPDNQDAVVDSLVSNGVKEENIVQPFKRFEKKIHIIDDDYDVEEYLTKSKIDEKKHSVAEATIYTIAYNTPKGMLCRTIESVLKQTFKEFEYLFIDNGSTDETANIVKKYAEHDSRIKYVRLEKNVPWANKVLLETLRDNIHTDYVAMVDSDDYYESDFLEKSLKIARLDKADLVQVNTLTYAHDGFKYSYFSHYLGGNFCVDSKVKEQYLMLRIINTPTWGKLIKVALFKKLINMMLSYESEEERDRNFCLDISWVAYLVMESSKVSLCDELLHVRTWRPGSSEHSDDHGSKWLSSMIWAIEYIKGCNSNIEYMNVYEDTALSWLFGLSRETYSLKGFRKEDIEYECVKAFLNRPLCDKYKL